MPILVPEFVCTKFDRKIGILDKDWVDASKSDEQLKC